MNKIVSFFSKRKSKSAGTKLPVFLPILEEMAREWEAITDEEIERAEMRLTPLDNKETKLGVLDSREVRQTWALAGKMRFRCAEARLTAQSRAHDQRESAFYMEQANRFDALEDCLKELFWAQAKDEIGGNAWEQNNTGIRRGWTLVFSKGQPLPPGLVQLFGGGFPGGGE